MVFADENRWRHRRRRGRGRAIAASAALIAFAGVAIYGTMLVADSSGARADPSAAGRKDVIPVPDVVIPVAKLPALPGGMSGSGSPGAPGSARPSRSPAATRPGIPSATLSAGSPGAGSALPGSQGIAVSYIVGEQWDDAFQGEVEVVNNTSRPLSGWQIVVGLPLDQVESVQNASASVTDHILFMNPESAADSIAPGAVLRVFFTAEGTETTPSGCAFDSVNCS